MSLIKGISDSLTGHYGRTRNLLYLLAALVVVISVGHEPNVAPLRSDVEGMLMGMGCFASLAILSNALLVLLGSVKQTALQVWGPTFVYIFAYVIVKDSGASAIDDIQQNPEKWIMFLVGGIFSYAIFGRYQKTVSSKQDLSVSTMRPMYAYGTRMRDVETAHQDSSAE